MDRRCFILLLLAGCADPAANLLPPALPPPPTPQNPEPVAEPVTEPVATLDVGMVAELARPIVATTGDV